MAEIIEALQPVRFTIAQDGKATDVIVSVEIWERLIAWLEDLEDSQVVKTDHKLGIVESHKLYLAYVLGKPMLFVIRKHIR